jgi:hypothetical protein
MQNIDLASNATNGWWLDELFGTDIIQISNGKRLKMSHQQFIETLIQSGCLDGIWEEDLFPTVVTRDGRTEKIDYFTDTKWGRDICDPRIVDAKSKQGKKFRRNFRVPFPVFDKVLVPECNRLNVFEVHSLSRVRVPTEIKVLICLRILGRGAYSEDMADMCGGFKSSIHAIFRKFLLNFTPIFYPLFVREPTGVKLQKIMQTYAKIGLAGAVGSVDVTHVLWGKCPKHLHSLCIGKEGKPSIAFECVVDHSYEILSVSKLIFGATNDINICRVDEYTKRFINGVYKNVRFEILVAVGVVMICFGAYLICDGGYPKYNCFICPLSNRVDRQAVIFSEYVESTRKDVECTFGQLKNRFRILKKGLEMTSLKEMELLFKACCILHNMILIYDRRDIMEWEINVDWELLDPDDQIEEEDDIENEEVTVGEIVQQEQLPIFTISNDEPMRLLSNGNNASFTSKLCLSFAIQFEMELLQWPRNFSPHQKHVLSKSRLERISQRAELDLYKTLVVSESNFRAFNPITNMYDISIGKGLKAGVYYKPLDRVVEWIQGERISKMEYDIRVAAGKGGYALKINAGELVDFFEVRDQCKASMVNDPSGCWDVMLNRKAKVNCRMHAYIRKDKYTFYLKAIDHIYVGNEIAYNYDNEYIFPLTNKKRK